MPKRPDVSARSALRGIAAYDPPAAPGERVPPADARTPSSSSTREPAEPATAPDQRFEDRFTRRTVYLRRDLLEQLERRRRQPGGKSLATQLDEALSAYLGR